MLLGAMKVYLDDARATPEGWERALTASHAITFLQGGEVTEISLDHDLGPPEAGTGYTVACWIEERAAAGEIRRLAWSIHSANPVGRAKMEAAMRSAERYWGAP